MRNWLTTGTLAALLSLAGCAAIDQQLSSMQASLEASKQQGIQDSFARTTDKAVAGAWYPQDKVAVAGAKLVGIDGDVIEYVVEGGTYDPEQLSAPLVAHYLADVKARGGKVKAYRPRLHAQALAATQLTASARNVVSMGTWNYVNGVGSLYIEYAPTGEMRSALLRKNFGEFSDPQRVRYAKSYVDVVFGRSVRALENQLSNTELKDNEIGGAAN